MKKLIWLAILLPLGASANPFTNDFCEEKFDDDICIGFNLDRARLEALEKAVEVTADCATPNAITGILNANSEKLVPLIITVDGVCADNIFLTRDKVVIQGDSNDGPDTIRAADNSDAVLRIDGANEIFISDLAITGDDMPTGSIGSGILCRRNAHVSINNVTVSKRRLGIFAGMSGQCDVTNSVVIDNVGTGVATAQNGAMLVLDTTISSNGAGVSVDRGGHITIIGGFSGTPSPATTTISGNAAEGIQVRAGSIRVIGNAGVAPVVIEGNTLAGVVVGNLGMFEPRFGVSIVDNGAEGISCSGFFELRWVFGGIVIAGNAGGDLSVECPALPFP